MNNPSKLFLVIGGGLMSFAILRYVYKNIILATDLDYSLQNVSITSIKPNLQGVITLSIINKSDIKLNLRNLNIKAFVSGFMLGELKQTSEITISAQGRSMVSLIFNVTPDNLTQNIKEILVNVISKKDIPIDFVGQVDAKSWLGYVTLPLKYSTSGKDLKSLYDEYYS